MVAKISFGSSLYGALAYNGEKINKEEGKLLATNKIFDDCSGKTSIANALRDFQRYLSPHIRTEKPVVHISLNPHPDDVLTDMDMENIAREYLSAWDMATSHTWFISMRTSTAITCTS